MLKYKILEHLYFIINFLFIYMNLCNDFSEEQKIYINSLSNKCGSSKTMHKIRKIIDTGLPENNTQALDKFKEIVRDSLDVSNNAFE